MAAARLHRELALVAEPVHETASPFDDNLAEPDFLSMRDGKQIEPTAIVRLALGFNSLFMVFVAAVINVLAYVYENVVLLRYATQYSDRVTALFFAHHWATGIPIDEQDVMDLCYADGFRVEYRAVNMSLTDEWGHMASVCFAILGIMAAFLAMVVHHILADHVLYCVALVTLLVMVNGCCCASLFYVVAGKNTSKNLGDAYDWTTDALQFHLASPSADLSILCAVPAASTTWALFSSLFFVFVYVLRVSGAKETALLGNAAINWFYPLSHLSPAALFIVSAFVMLIFYHTFLNTSRFMSLGRGR